ncbi:MAG: F0F1 ATP synthase subunit delta [Actinobacteria bacterium]|nr:F0F1 ATP synthase subunit delta [Actinomycetota bacterium]
MRGASRASFSVLREQLEAAGDTSAAEATRLGDELFAVAGLLDREHGLRRALSDPGKPAAEKAAVAAALLHGKISDRAEALVAAAAEGRWATPGDMVDAIEQLAIEAMVLAADATDSLDDLEDELFRFGRVVAGQPELRAALADPVLPRDRKDGLLHALLDGKVSPVTFGLTRQMVAHPRGRALAGSLEMCADIAARRRQQLIAVVRSAVELSAGQRGRLADALAASYGHRVHLNVVIDPSVVGGISVQIGDELIDGTAASRLAAVRRKLAG